MGVEVVGNFGGGVEAGFRTKVTERFLNIPVKENKPKTHKHTHVHLDCRRAIYRALQRSKIFSLYCNKMYREKQAAGTKNGMYFLAPEMLIHMVIRSCKPDV